MKIQLFLIVLGLTVFAYPATASTYYVGSCHANSFSTISAAVAAVPAGSILNVCPGVYSEQVIISKSLTLQGITSENQNTVEICCLAGSTAQSALFGSTLQPTIWVTAGTVNISNVFLSAHFGEAINCPVLPTAIFFASGSSGTVNHVVTSVMANNCGVGIWAENQNSESDSVKIENSYIDSDGYGMLFAARQPEDIAPVLWNTVTGNTVVNGLYGVYLFQTLGKVSGNNIILGPNSNSESDYGIYEAAPATTITGNMINLPGGGTGVVITGAFSTVTDNKILGVGVGIDLGCATETVSGNTIFASTGLNHVPSTFTGKNTFLTSETLLNGGC
jgi:hypothetical protein